MKGSKKLQREIASFVDECRQKDAAKQAANYPSPMGERNKIYDNSLWNHLFFEKSALNAEAGRIGKSKNV